MLIKNVAKYIKEKKAQKENIKLLNFAQDLDDSAFAFGSEPQEPIENSAVILEGDSNSLSLIDFYCSDQDHSGFNYFLDGIERKRVLFYHNFIPVTYGYMSAAIIKRENKIMSSAEFMDTKEFLYLPFVEDGDEPEFYFKVDDFLSYEIYPFNIGTKSKNDEDYPKTPQALAKRAHSAIQENRRKMESSLAKKWLKEKSNSKDWLFVDGGLTSITTEVLDNSNVVGVIKSHNVQFFDYKDQCKLYKLKKGQRSCVFQPLDGNNKEKKVFSWYMKLHENNRGSIDFGLIRIEIPAKQQLLSKVNQISQWILLEAKPVAFPASRWDRMIYPIKYCEDYLKSKAPSWSIIQGIS